MFINYVLKVGLELFVQYNLRVSTTKHVLHAINKLKQENKVPMQMKSQSYIKRLNFFHYQQHYPKTERLHNDSTKSAESQEDSENDGLI